jgi:uncharacterized protein (DUF697 family)
MATYGDTIRQVLDGHFDHATPEEREEGVRNLIQACSIAAAAAAVQPFPVLDAVLITPIQIGLVQGIGRIHGHKLDKKAVIEIMSSFGASLVAQSLIMAASKFVPFIGWVIGPSMAYALTYAIGEVSDFYFQSGRGVAPDDLKEMFDKIYKQKRAEKERSHKSDSSLKDRLEQLKAAHQSGLLTDEEFAKKKEDLLKSF